MNMNEYWQNLKGIFFQRHKLCLNTLPVPVPLFLAVIFLISSICCWISISNSIELPPCLPVFLSKDASRCSSWISWLWLVGVSWDCVLSATPMRWSLPVGWLLGCSVAFLLVSLQCMLGKCRPLPSVGPSGPCTSSVLWWAS